MSLTKQALPVAAALVFLGGGFWGVEAYRAKQEREVEVPQRLLDHLESVHRGQARLDSALLQPEPLRRQQADRIRAQLARDLTGTGHPEPDIAVGALFPAATAYLQDHSALLGALTRHLQALPDTPWETRERTPERWWVQAGDQCLQLRYLTDTPEVVWQWVAIGDCPPRSE